MTLDRRTFITAAAGATGAVLAAGQGHVECLGLQLRLQLGIGQGSAAFVQGRLDGLLGQVDGGAARLFFFDAERGHALHELGHTTAFAQKLRLGIFQLGRRGGLGEQGLGISHQRVQLCHLKHLEWGRWQASHQ